MVDPMSYRLTRRTRAKTILVALALIVLVITLLPQNVAASETREVINASEILGKISRGEPVEYVDYIIIGDLDVSDLRKDLEEIEVKGIPKRVVESEISIRNSKIEGTVNFNPIYFNNTVEFENVIFESGVSFFYANFDKRTNFHKSTFKSSADFGHATFNDIAYFDGIDFSADVDFRNVTFNNAARFGFSNVYGDYTVFDNTFFNKSTHFTRFTVTGYTQCTNVTFNDSVDFRWASFGRTVLFREARFNGPADFLWVTFDGPVSFDNVVFKAPVNFVLATFSDTASFQNARFNDTADFSLAKFREESFFQVDSFEKEVDFTGTYILLMHVEWSELEGKLVYDEYFYQSLIRNFESLGSVDESNEAYYAYHVEKRKRIQSPSKRLLEYLFLDRSCGYGVKPWRALISGGVVIIFFTVFYWAIKEKSAWFEDKRFRDSLFVSCCIFTSLGKWSSKWFNWERDKQ